MERRKLLFQQGKKIRYIRFREALYPLFVQFLILDRIFQRQEITVSGAQKKYNGPTIYACTHIGGDDLQRAFEAIGRGCWWFVGDPGFLYRDISGLLLHLNGCIMLETAHKGDRHIAYLRSVELLKAGGSLMIFPEGARNFTENLPVMELYPGTAKMALETHTKIIPVGIEQYGKRIVIHFGSQLHPKNFRDQTELTQKLRDTLATLKWEIWKREEPLSRASLPQNYGEQFLAEFEARIRPYDSLEAAKRTRYRSKTPSPQEAFAHLGMLHPCKENAFLFRELEKFIG